MCGGASRAEKNEAAQQQQFDTTLQNDFNSRFAQQNQTIASLNQELTPLVQAGPSQQGMSASELAASNTQAINATGANYANAARAVNSQLAAKGGSDANINGVTGPQAQIDSAIATQAAGNLSNDQLGITEKNYDLGRENWRNANAGLLALNGQYDPAAFGSEFNSGNNDAFKMSDQINEESQQGLSSLVGGITGLASTGLSIASKF